MGVLDYDTTPGDNTSINGINILGTSAVANFDNAFRQIMADIATGIHAAQFMATGYVTKSAGYTVVVGDKGTVFDCTAALELDLPAAATAGAGFFIDIKANGGAVTVDPNGTENINGASTSLVIADGASARVLCDGTAWHSAFTAATINAASETVAGIVELATTAEAQTGTDTARAVTPAGLNAAAIQKALLTTRGDIIYRDASAPARLAKGTEGQVLTMGVDDPAWADPAGVATLAAAQATTSGTAIDFTGIPAGVNQIDVLLDGVGLSGTDNLLVQLGTSGGVVSSGYSSNSASIVGTTITHADSTAGFILRGASTVEFRGILSLRRVSGDVWVSTHVTQSAASSSLRHGAGAVSLGGALTRLRLTRSGSNTFSAGSVSILYT